MSHSLTVSSVKLPVASTRPSGEVATDRMPMWPPPLQTMGGGPCARAAAASRMTEKKKPTNRRPRLPRRYAGRVVGLGLTAELRVMTLSRPLQVDVIDSFLRRARRFTRLCKMAAVRRAKRDGQAPPRTRNEAG